MKTVSSAILLLVAVASMAPPSPGALPPACEVEGNDLWCDNGLIKLVRFEGGKAPHDSKSVQIAADREAILLSRPDNMLKARRRKESRDAGAFDLVTETNVVVGRIETRLLLSPPFTLAVCTDVSERQHHSLGCGSRLSWVLSGDNLKRKRPPLTVPAGCEQENDVNRVVCKDGSSLSAMTWPAASRSTGEKEAFAHAAALGAVHTRLKAERMPLRGVCYVKGTATVCSSVSTDVGRQAVVGFSVDDGGQLFVCEMSSQDERFPEVCRSAMAWTAQK